MKETLKVLVVKAGEKPYVKEIDSGLKSLQAEVGGFIECLYPWKDPVALICNEEGKLLSLPENRILFSKDTGRVWDVICGTFLLTGLGSEDFASLSEQEIEILSQMFQNVMVPMSDRLETDMDHSAKEQTEEEYEK